MESDSTQFACQQCKQPIVIDASLVDLTPSAYDVLQASLPARRVASGSAKPGSEKELLDRVPASNTAKETWKQAQLNRKDTNQPPEQSYVLLQDSILKDVPPASPPSRKQAASSAPTTPKSPKSNATTVNSPNPKQIPLSHQLRSHTKLFNLLSSRTDIDHPLCEECTHVLLTALTKRLEETKKERDGYLAFEREIRKERERPKSDDEDIDAKIKALKLEERQVTDELKEAEAEKKELEEELAALEEEERALAEEEEDFFTSYNATLLKTKHLNATLDSLHTSLAHASALLSKLERTNVYADAFCIGVDGAFGTINGLRFGRSGGGTMSGTVLSTNSVPASAVEWAEVNAAWGLTVLCLSTIARKLDYDFQIYTLNPRASFSTITHHPTPANKSKGDTYELYASTDLHLGRLLHNRRFDAGMVLFLDALRLIMVHVKDMDPNVEFPHPIIKDKIGDASIKLQFSQEEVWTRALRHVLLALKIVLRWMTNGG